MGQQVFPPGYRAPAVEILTRTRQLDFMKSAYELAMERLQKEDPDSGVSLTEDQKQALAGLDDKYKAKIAEREVFLNKQLLEARKKGDREAMEQLKTQLRNERLRLQEEREAAKEKVRKAATES
jgi:hypothetical protein